MSVFNEIASDLYQWSEFSVEKVPGGFEVT